MNLHANSGVGSASSALTTVFGDDAPTDSAFGQMRNKVSWKFFESAFSSTVKSFCEKLRPQYKGYYLTAVDGDQYLLERRKDALEKGFKGQKCGKNKETMSLKMYLTVGTCMITGAPLAITTSSDSNELMSGLETTQKIIDLQNLHSKNKTTLNNHIFSYDRLYFSVKLIDLHKTNGTFFVARCKSGGTFTEVKEFIQSDEKTRIVEINGVKMRLIKITHNETEYRYATNLLDENIADETISWIYFRRWQSETTNCDGVKTLGIERFHSSKINGIRQEIYASYWALLISKSNRNHVKQAKEDFDKKTYRRQNTKNVFGTLVKNTKLIIYGFTTKLCSLLDEESIKTSRKITRLSRQYPRMRKYNRQKKYPQLKSIEITTS